jgi:hypothetical protein
MADFLNSWSQVWRQQVSGLETASLNILLIYET